ASVGPRPKTLSAFVRDMGLNPSKVFAGEVEQLGLSGLINRRRGVDLDEAAQRAGLAGYIELDEHGKESVSGFLDALAQDISAARVGGQRVLVPRDREGEQKRRDREDAKAKLE